MKGLHILFGVSLGAVAMGPSLLAACNALPPGDAPVVPMTKAAQDVAKAISVAGNAQKAVGGACAVLVPLSAIAGPAAPYIDGACAGDAIAAKIALDPSTDAWLIGLANMIGKPV